MLIGKVVGNIWSTRKTELLNGYKLMSVEIIGSEHQKMVVVDILSAGMGDRVIITTGSSARRMIGDDGAPVDACIVGIIDEECPID